jgi:hypothetical protein
MQVAGRDGLFNHIQSRFPGIGFTCTNVFAFCCLHGIQIPDLSTNIADECLLIKQRVNKAVNLKPGKIIVYG